jgi:hypothetical protein
MTSNEDIASETGADVARAVVLLRVAARAVDRLAESSREITIHPQLGMALIESSQSAQRALVMLTEAKQLLADRDPRLSVPDVVTDGIAG